jgi:two-component system chemotaxis sensor kinase CheA
MAAAQSNEPRRSRSVSLGTKLAGATLAVLALLTFAVYVKLIDYQRSNVLAAKQTAAQMVARLFAASVSAPLTFGDDKGVGESVATLATNPDVGYSAAWVVDSGKLGQQLGELKRTDAKFDLPATVPSEMTTARTHDWVIVDSPVKDPDGKTVGLSRVAFSLAAENQAIAVMEKRTLLISAGVGLALAAVLLALSRLLIVRPLSKLGHAAKKLESGERVEIKADGDDEIGELARAFGAMSNAIAAREERIRERNRDMRLVLDHVEDGFISVDRQGQMTDERSAILDRWFAPPKPGASFFDYLESISPEVAQWMQLGWDTLIEDVLPVECAIDALPKRFMHEGSNFEIRYTPINDDKGTLTGVLVGISDVSLRVARERAEAGQREMLAIFKRMLADRGGFGSFLEECGGLVDAIATYEGDDLGTLRRQIHTLKGNTALFGIESIARLCHDLETRLIEGGSEPTSDELAQARAMWESLLARCAELGWSSQSETLQLQLADVRELLSAVRAGADRNAITAMVSSWSHEPAMARLSRIGEQVTALATKLGKSAPKVEIAPTKLRLPSKKWAPLLTSLAHVVRNVVDHGIEEDDLRKASGKPTPATVKMSIASDGNGHVVLSLGDDGRGIDWARIREKAKAIGLPHRTAADLEEALYADSVSSKEQATETSGRGVGMGAVRDVVRACGGEIKIETALGVGTTFRFVLPDEMLISDEVATSKSGTHRSVRPVARQPAAAAAGSRG